MINSPENDVTVLALLNLIRLLAAELVAGENFARAIMTEQVCASREGEPDEVSTSQPAASPCSSTVMRTKTLPCSPLATASAG